MARMNFCTMSACCRINLLRFIRRFEAWLSPGPGGAPKRARPQTPMLSGERQTPRGARQRGSRGVQGANASCWGRGGEALALPNNRVCHLRNASPIIKHNNSTRQNINAEGNIP